MVISFVGHYSSIDQVPIGLWFMLGVTALGLIVAVFVRPELRRVKIDSNKEKPELGLVCVCCGGGGRGCGG